MSSSILIPIIVVLLVVEKSTICSLAIKNNVTFDCFPRERRALLRFKASFSGDPSNNMLSSWRTNSDCCAWPGVECDSAATGHVVGLNLRYRYESPYNMLRSKAVDSSLLELKYLSYLDLSGNDFQSSPIPSFLGSMKQLQYLNLAHAGFAGTVPHQLGNLSSLRTLDLEDDHLDGYNLIVDDITWVINLSSLEYLDMSNVNLSATKDLVKVLGMLHSLVELRLPNCGLDKTNIALFTNNVQHLDLSDNSFGENSSFYFLQNMTSLSLLDLSFNHLPGSIPSFIGNLKTLIVLDLSNNNLSGPIPSTLKNLRALRVLDLSYNQLSGEIPISLGQLSNLEIFDIIGNAFKGTLSEPHFAKLSKLKTFYVGYNYELKLRVGYDWVTPFHQLKSLSMESAKIIGGKFPQWLQTQKSLIDLDLSNCSITGTLPKWLSSSLVNLTILDLSNNQIEGPIPELPSNLTSLDLSNNHIKAPIPDLPSILASLDLSNNHIEGPITDLPSGLARLDLSGNFINGSIPDSLCQMRSLERLDLSDNHLSGKLPHCLGNLDSLGYAILSSNQISGPIPNSIGGAYRLNVLQLNNNSLTGGIPSSLKNCMQLSVLDLGDNMLSGELPEWIGNHLLYLEVLRLRNNKLHGDIPSAYCNLSKYLQIMDLAQNQLTGNIPNCFGNFSAMVKDNGLSVAEGILPTVSMREMMKGIMLEYTTTLGYLVSLDLSSNRLSGKIPSELTTLTGLNALNLSHNHLRGTMPGKIGDMISLESFDLSSNNLHGTIPQSLSKLTSLSFLNLSNNDLSGQIATGPQLQTFTPLSYEGNPRLCGDPLPKKCKIYNDKLPGSRNVENYDTDKIFLYVSIITGFAIGFWGYFGVLVFKRSWRLALFRLMDALIGKMLGRY